MKFLREISVDKISDKVILDLEQFGYTLVWLKDSVEVWVDMTPTEKAQREEAVKIAA